MQKILFQTLLIAAIIGASVGQAYAQGSCTAQAPTPTPPTPPKPPKNIPKSEWKAWKANWTATWIANWNANYYQQQCDQWAINGCLNTNSGVCYTDYKPECSWCFCECSPPSPDKENVTDKRVERHKEVINENSDTNGNASE